MSHSSLPSPQRAPRTVDRCPLPTSIHKTSVIRLRDGLFLHSYGNDRIFTVADLRRTKLFSTPPISAVDVFHAEVLTVLVNADGSGVRRTLLHRATTGAPMQFAAAKQ